MLLLVNAKAESILNPSAYTYKHSHPAEEAERLLKSNHGGQLLLGNSKCTAFLHLPASKAAWNKCDVAKRLRMGVFIRTSPISLLISDRFCSQGSRVVCWRFLKQYDEPLQSLMIYCVCACQQAREHSLKLIDGIVR